MSVIGQPRSFHKGFLFKVEIPGVKYTGFQKVGEIKADVAVIEQWEGGARAADKSPGRYKTADVTLERGATKDHDLWTWFKQVADMSRNGLSEVDAKYKREVDIVQLDLDGTERERWTLHDAWPTAFSAGSFDNTADSNRIESVTLTYKYFDPTPDAST